MLTSNGDELQPEDFSAIEGLARETSQPIEEVGKMYSEVREYLSSGARIHDYLTLLTCKKVRDLLRGKRSSTWSNLDVGAGSPQEYGQVAEKAERNY